MIIRRSPPKACRRRCAMPRLRRMRRMRNTCRRIFSRASAIGRNRLRPIIASVQAAKASKEVGDQLHGQDYLVYAYLQLGQDKEARGVVDDIEAAQPESRCLRRRFCARRLAGALHGGTRRLEGRGRVSTSCRANFRMSWRSLISRARSAPRAPAIRRPPRPIPPSLPKFATACVKPRTIIGPVRSMFSSRPRTPGYFTPTANMMKRSRR